MKCLVKTCKNNSLLMTVELCYPCSQLVEQGNDFKPNWDTLQPYIDRIAELEQEHGFDRTASHMAGEYVDTAEPNREWVGLTNDEIDNLNLSNKIKIKQLILLIETKLKEKNLCR